MRLILRNYRLLLVVFLIVAIICLYQPVAGRQILAHTAVFVKQMLVNMPPIFIMLSLLDAWIPREFMVRFLGGKSGPAGTLLTMVLGTAAAGPLYGAYPVAATLLKKGASFLNAMVFLGAWSTLKLPMVLYEISTMGLKFGLARMLVNIPGIVLIAVIVNCFVSEEEKKTIHSQCTADLENA